MDEEFWPQLTEGMMLFNEGHYRPALDVLNRLWVEERARMSPLMKHNMLVAMSDCHRSLEQWEAALSYTKQQVALDSEVCGPRSKQHAGGLRALSEV